MQDSVQIYTVDSFRQTLSQRTSRTVLRKEDAVLHADVWCVVVRDSTQYGRHDGRGILHHVCGDILVAEPGLSYRWFLSLR